MIKYLFILFNSIVLFIYSVFTGDNGITVTSNFPATLIINQEQRIEIKVNKGKMGGFAKLQLDLPEAFVVKEIDNKGASFSFNNGIAKWIWSSLPSEDEIIVVIGLIPGEAAHGVKTIGAKYSYVENNVKQQVDMKPIEVSVINNGETAVASEANNNKVIADSSSVPIESISVSSHAEPTGTIEIVRTFSAGSTTNETLIQVVIKKGNTSGFARYSDELENGFTAKAIKTDGSSFSVADQKIKFVWVNVPDKEELIVIYSLQRTGSKQAIKLNGEYSYLEHNQSKKSKAELQTIPFEEISNAVVAAETNTASVSEKQMEVKQETTAVIETAKKQELKVEPTIENDVKDQNSAENIATETKLEKNQSQAKFSVQIGAFTNAKVAVKTLKNKFKINEQIRSEMKDGYSKFMIGNHQEYLKARGQRDKVINSNGVKSAFVVAYNNGQRITVQEALMISNQKWFK